jgi:hypothetical protein
MAVAAVGMLAACGGGSSPSTPTPVATPTPAPPPRVVQQAVGTIPASTIGLLAPFSIDGPGAVDVTLDWTFARNDMDVALLRGPCTSIALLEQGNCPLLGLTDNRATKPERLHVGGLSAGSYTILIGNLTTEDESAAIQVVFTPGATASQGPVALGWTRGRRVVAVR